MVLIQYVIDVSTSTANTAAGRPPVSQYALHALAGRECSISILNISTSTTAGVTANFRMARIDFMGIQPTNRGIPISSGSTSLDEASCAYGFVFAAMPNYNATSLGGTSGSTYASPPTFTAIMSQGNALGINVLPYNTQPGMAPQVAWAAFMAYVCVTIDVVPID